VGLNTPDLLNSTGNVVYQLTKRKRTSYRVRRKAQDKQRQPAVSRGKQGVFLSGIRVRQERKFPASPASLTTNYARHGCILPSPARFLITFRLADIEYFNGNYTVTVEKWQPISAKTNCLIRFQSEKTLKTK